MKKRILLSCIGIAVLVSAAGLIATKSIDLHTAPAEHSSLGVRAAETGGASSGQAPESSGELRKDTSYDLSSEVERRANEIMRTYHLAYDEGYIYDVGGERFEVSGAKPLTDRTEIAKYYPNLTVRQSLGGYEFYDMTVGEVGISNNLSDRNQKSDQVFKRDISILKSGRLSLRYRKGEHMLTITVSEKSKRLSNIFKEQLKLNGKYEGYTVLKGLPGIPDYYYGYRLPSDDGKYNIEVSEALTKDQEESGLDLTQNMAAPVTSDIESCNTYEGMIRLIDLLNLKEENQKLLKELTLL